jgi:hypothetical protein
MDAAARDRELNAALEQRYLAAAKEMGDTQTLEVDPSATYEVKLAMLRHCCIIALQM